MNITFATLIQQILDEQDINLTELSNLLYNLGLNITYSALYSYYSNSSVPPFETARKILKLCKVETDREDLEQILLTSKEVSKNESIYKERIMRLDVKIKPENISKDFAKNPDGLRNLIDLRAEELFGNEELTMKYSAVGKRKLGAYISYLIKKDLTENDIIKEND